MGALGRAKRQEGLDINGLASTLTNERRKAETMSAGTIDVLSMLLDTDRDGQVADDISQAGMGLLGRLLRRRR
jgi:predicted amino acid racemase